MAAKIKTLITDMKQLINQFKLIKNGHREGWTSEWSMLDNKIITG